MAGPVATKHTWPYRHPKTKTLTTRIAAGFVTTFALLGSLKNKEKRPSSDGLEVVFFWGFYFTTISVNGYT